MTEGTWFRASNSDTPGVEVAPAFGGVFIRPARTTGASPLFLDSDSWKAFLEGVKNNEFDSVLEG